MAIFLPDLHSKNLKLTPGERRFGTCLYRSLENDYHCWINVPIGPKEALNKQPKKSAVSSR